MADNGKVVLVTGASRGIGEAAARLLKEGGYNVFGTSRAPEIPPAPGIDMLELDVREDDSVQECVGKVLERAGRLDVLVNNAGYAHSGPLENCSVDDFHNQFEVNLFGVHRMVRAVLPQMFTQGSGRIVNVSSAIGRVAIPFAAVYCSSKFALEGYSEGLAHELKPQGIDVVIMEPGLTATDFHKHGTRSAETAERYGPAIEQRRAEFPKILEQADSAEDVARVIYEAVSDKHPRLRYLAPAAERQLGKSAAAG